MGKCDNPGCDGHLGKYPDCIAEALMHLDPEEETGNTEWEAWYALYRFTSAEASQPVRVNWWDPEITVDIPTATYILGEDSRGAVFYTGYTDPAVAMAAWGEIVAQFTEWDADQ